LILDRLVDDDDFDVATFLVVFALLLFVVDEVALAFLESFVAASAFAARLTFTLDDVSSTMFCFFFDATTGFDDVDLVEIGEDFEAAPFVLLPTTFVDLPLDDVDNRAGE
jgi:hypothetical protein